MHVVLMYPAETIGQCVPKLGVIWRVHRRFDAPLTTVVVGRVAVREGAALKRLIDEGGDLFDGIGGWPDGRSQNSTRPASTA